MEGFVEDESIKEKKKKRDLGLRVERGGFCDV